MLLEIVSAMSSSGVSARVWVYGPDGNPTVKLLGTTRTLIGRADHCDVCLVDGGVSRDHLEISLHGAVLVATDLDSMNGTVLNGRQLDRPTRLNDGDVLLMGNHRLQVEIVPEAQERGRTTRRAVQIAKLNDEELEIARALVGPYRSAGRLAPATRKELALELSMSESKVKRRMASIAQKLGLPLHESRDRPRLIAERVIELGLDLRR
jgi:pSer/pThr/pTyr-binding forkhead associated (FHA) protein